MMHVKHLFCTVFITLAVAVTAYGANYTAQTITVSTAENSEENAIEIKNSKVITDSFSFKVPDGWAGNCIVVPVDGAFALYNKTDYEADGSGLLFTIEVFDNSSYEDLTDYSVLGFCGQSTYILIDNYITSYPDSSSPEYQSCKEAVKTLKKSFVSFVK